MNTRPLVDLCSKARLISDGWATQKPSFQLHIGFADAYEELLAGKYTEQTSESKILDVARRKGRVILSGRAGSGKTWLLRRLYKLAIDREWLPIYVDMKQWSGKDYEVWENWTSDSVTNGTEYLLEKFSSLGVGALGLDALEPEMVKVLFIDGLNEIASKTGADVLSIADELATHLMNTSVVVADRLTRRDLPSASRWVLAGVLPLSPEEVRNHLPNKSVIQANDICKSPFFLDAQMRRGHHEAGRASMLESLILQDDALTLANAIDRIAKASFEAYVTFRSRSFKTSYFENAVGAEVFRRLSQASILASSDDNSYFVHHILHDYLASRHFSQRDKNQWTPENFRALSFEASSFDALELTFEQLHADRAELFLRKLYDWNLYAAGYALAELNETNADPIGKEMRTVIFAMLAEKRFDLILATKERAEDALRVIQVNDVLPFRDAKSISEVSKAIQLVESNSAWFLDWKRIFSSPGSEPLGDEMVSLLGEDDSVKGWTVSNVIRRYPHLDLDWIAAKMEQLLNEGPLATVRWRVAHVLGAIPNDQSKVMLLKLLDADQDADVRYGAIRSVIEIAAKGDATLRAKLASSIQKRAVNIAAEPKISRELRACLLIDPQKAPADWLAFVKTCIRSQFEAIDGVSEKDLWRGKRAFS